MGSNKRAHKFIKGKEGVRKLVALLLAFSIIFTVAPTAFAVTGQGTGVDSTQIDQTLPLTRNEGPVADPAAKPVTEKEEVQDDNGYEYSDPATFSLATTVAADAIPIATWDHFTRIGSNEKVTIEGQEYTFAPDANYVQTVPVLKPDIAAHPDQATYQTLPLFKGTYNGNNYTIDCTGITTWKPFIFEGGEEYPIYGLFGAADGATFENINLTNMDMNIPTQAWRVAGLVGTVRHFTDIGGYTGAEKGSIFHNISLTDMDFTLAEGTNHFGTLTANFGYLYKAGLNPEAGHSEAVGISGKNINISMGATSKGIYLGGLIGYANNNTTERDVMRDISLDGFKTMVNATGGATPVGYNLSGVVANYGSDAVSGSPAILEQVRIKDVGIKIVGDSSSISSIDTSGVAKTEKTLTSDITAENVFIDLSEAAPAGSCSMSGVLNVGRDSSFSNIAATDILMKAKNAAEISGIICAGGLSAKSEVDNVVKDAQIKNVKIEIADGGGNAAVYAGGASGISAGSMDGVYVQGTINVASGTGNVGGLIGSAENYASIYLNCTANVAVKTPEAIKIGGFAGRSMKTGAVLTTGSFKNCVWVKNFTTAQNDFGAAAGANPLTHAGISNISVTPGSIANLGDGQSQVITSTTGGDYAFGGLNIASGGDCISLENANDAAKATVKATKENGSAVVNATFKKEGAPDIVVPVSITTTGAQSFIPVYTWEQFDAVGRGGQVEINGKTYTMAANATYRQMNDIAATASNYVTKPTFSGTYDGANHTIDLKGISEWNEYEKRIGLFGLVDSGAIKNITVKNATIEKGQGNQIDHGGVLAGACKGAVLSDITMEQASLSLQDASNVGSIAGQILNATQVNRVTVKDIQLICENISYGYTYWGGVFGSAYDDTVMSDITAVDVTLNDTGDNSHPAQKRTGGIAGLVSKGATLNGLNARNIDISIHCKKGLHVGGLIGLSETGSANGTVLRNSSLDGAKLIGEYNGSVGIMGGVIGAHSVAEGNSFEVTDVTAKNVDIDLIQTGGTYGQVGGFSGGIYGKATYTNCSTDADVAIAKIDENLQAGGFGGVTGKDGSFSFTNCSAAGKLATSGAGWTNIASGFIGDVEAGVNLALNDCATADTVSHSVKSGGTHALGGFIGRNNNTAVITANNCVWVRNFTAATENIGTGTAVATGISPILVTPDKITNLAANATQKLTATTAGGFGAPTWASSDAAVAIVDNTGLVTAKAVDKAATITAKFTKAGLPDINIPVSVGTGSGWIEIDTWEKFKAVGTGQTVDGVVYANNANYIQTANIASTDATYTTKPEFFGIYDGGGYTLDLASIGKNGWTAGVSSILASNTDLTGLFGTVTGTLQNIMITNANMKSVSALSSALVAYAGTGAKVNNCAVSNSKLEITPDMAYQAYAGAGLVVGEANGAAMSGLTVRNSSFTTVRTAQQLRTVSFGGIVGTMIENSILENSCADNVLMNIGLYARVNSSAALGVGQVVTGSRLSSVTTRNCKFDTNNVQVSSGNETVIFSVGGVVGSSDGYRSPNKDNPILIENCTAENNMIRFSSNVAGNRYLRIGGMIAAAEFGTTVQNSRVIGGTLLSEADNTPDSMQIGGFIGYAGNTSAMIENCSAEGVEIADHSTNSNRIDIGGFAGRITAYTTTVTTLSNCFATGSISSEENGKLFCIGGFVGDVLHNNSAMIGVTNCYTAVKSNVLSGGFVGYNTAPVANATYTNCMWAKNGTNANANAGGTVPIATGISALSVTPDPISLMKGESKPLTSSLDTTASDAYCGYKFAGWTSSDANVVIANTTAANTTVKANAADISGTITAKYTKDGAEDILIPVRVTTTGDWIKIATWEDFIAMDGTGNYIQTADIKAPAGTDYTTKPELSGIYDGQNHTIDFSGVTKWDINQSMVGAFAKITGTAKNWELKGIKYVIAAPTIPIHAGGLVAWAAGATIENVHVSADIAADVSSRSGVLAGTSDSSSFKNCSSTGAVRGTSKGGAGGFVGGVGTVFASEFYNCYTTAAVFATGQYIGAFYGANNAVPKLDNCVWSRFYSGDATKGHGMTLPDLAGLRQLTLTPDTSAEALSLAPKASTAVTAESGANIDALGLQFYSYTTQGPVSTAWTLNNPATTATAQLVSAKTDAKVYANYKDTRTGKVYTMGTVNLSVDPAALIEIKTWDDFKKIGTEYPLNGTYLQTGDFSVPVLDGLTASLSRGAFTGTYDGNGRTITIDGNLGAVDGSVGLFSKIDGGTVKNLVLNGGGAGIINSAAQYTGALAGSATNGAVVENIKVNNMTLRSLGDYVGGLVGLADNTTITGCGINADVTGTAFVGGIVGAMRGNAEIKNSGADAKTALTGSRDGAAHGAFVGRIEATAAKVENVYALGASEYFVGVNSMSADKFANCIIPTGMKAAGSTSTVANVAQIRNFVTDPKDTLMLNNGQMGTAVAIKADSGVFDMKFKAWQTVDESGNPKEDANITFANANAANTTFAMAKSAATDSYVRATYVNTAGSEMNSAVLKLTPPAAVISVPDWYTFEKIGNDPAYPMDAHYVQTGDITAPTNTTYQTKDVFTGTYDGAGFVIDLAGVTQMVVRNVTLPDRGNVNTVGLFGAVSNGTIKNLQIENMAVDDAIGSVAPINVVTGNALISNVSANNISIAVQDEAHLWRAAAGVVGEVINGAVVENIHVSDLTIDATAINAADASTGIMIGGLVGIANGGGIVRGENTANNVTLNLKQSIALSMRAGLGISNIENGAKVSGLKVKNSKMNVTGAGKQVLRLGGLLGYIPSGASEIKDSWIENCALVVSGTDTSTSFLQLGGAVGYAKAQSVVENVHASGVELSTTVSKGYASYVGGFIGAIGEDATIKNCTADTNSNIYENAQSTKSKRYGGFVGWAGGYKEISDCGSRGVMNIVKDGSISNVHEIGGFVGGIGTTTVGVRALRNCYTATTVICAPSEGSFGGFAGKAVYSAETQNGMIEDCMWVKNFTAAVKNIGVAENVTETQYDSGITAMEVSPDKITNLAANATQQLTSTTGAGWALDSYDSSDDAAVTVDANGVVTAKADGKSATVTAKFTKAGLPDIDIPISVGTGSEWIEVDTWEKFKAVGTGQTVDGVVYTNNAKYIQTKDIVATDAAYTTKPEFSGVYDGGGHNLDMSSVATWTANGDKLGIFGKMSGTLKNLRIRNMSVADNATGVRYVAPIGSAGGVIENVSANNINITITEKQVNYGGFGGLVGYLEPGSTMADCHADRIMISADCIRYSGDNNASTLTAGGLVGTAAGKTMSNASASNIQITCTGGFLGQSGGVIGMVQNTLDLQSVEINGLRAKNIKITAKRTTEKSTMSSIGGVIGFSTKYNPTGGVTGAGSVSDVRGENIELNGTEISYIGGYAGSVSGANDVAAMVHSDIGITNCKIVAEDISSAGGLVGQVQAGKIENAYTTANVTVSNVKFAGGFVGELRNNTGASDSYAAGSISGTAEYMGAFMGDYWNTPVSNNFYVSNFYKNLPTAGKGNDKVPQGAISALSVTPDPMELTKGTAMDITSSLGTIADAAYCGYQFAGWTATSGLTLTDAAAQNTTVLTDAGGLNGFVTAKYTKAGAPDIDIRVNAKTQPDQIPVSTWDDFLKVGTAGSVTMSNGTTYRLTGNETFVQTGDIAVPENTVYQTKDAFYGTYDGGGYSIDLAGVSAWKAANIVMTAIKVTVKNDPKNVAATSIGLFGEIDGTIKNLAIKNAAVDSSAHCTGVLAGYAYNANISGISVTNVGVNVSGVDTRAHYAAGLVGASERSTLSDLTMTNTQVKTTNTYDAFAASIGRLNQCVLTGNNEVNSSKVTIDSVTWGSAGIAMSQISDSQVENLTINGGAVTVSNASEYLYIGSVSSGINCGGTLKNILVKNPTISIDSAGAKGVYTGGFSSDLKVHKGENLHVEGGRLDVTGGALEFENIGGFAYAISVNSFVEADVSTLQNCSTSIDVSVNTTAPKKQVGGFMALVRLENTKTVMQLDNLYTTANVAVGGSTNAADDLGGFAGNIGNYGADKLKIKNCYTAAKFPAAAGGFVGKNDQTSANIKDTTYQNCMYVGNFTDAKTVFGTTATGVLKDHPGISTLSVSPATLSLANSMSGTLSASEAGGFTLDSWTQKTGADIATIAPVADTNTATVTAADTGNGAASFNAKFMRSGYPDIDIPVSAVVTSGGTIPISTWEEFEKIGNDAAYPLTAKYVQTADIAAPENTAYTTKDVFAGSYDGDGYTIDLKGVTAVNETADSNGIYIGLFGSVSGDLKNITVQNLKEINTVCTQDTRVSTFGTLAAITTGNVSDVTGKNISVEVTSDSAGGVVGLMQGTDNKNISGEEISLIHHGAVWNTGGIVGGIGGIAGVQKAALSGLDGKNVSVTRYGDNGDGQDRSYYEQRLGGLMGIVDAEVLSVDTVQANNISVSYITENGGRIGSLLGIGGIFGLTQSATIQAVEGNGIVVKSDLQYAAADKTSSSGAAIGVAYNNDYRDIHISNASVNTINQQCIVNTGGMFGSHSRWETNNGFTNCSIDTFDVSVTTQSAAAFTTKVGGFSGLIKAGNMENCYASSGRLSVGTRDLTNTMIGGFAGESVGANAAVLNNCYASVQLNQPIEASAQAAVGGFIGVKNNAPQFIDCMWGKNVASAQNAIGYDTATSAAADPAGVSTLSATANGDFKGISGLAVNSTADLKANLPAYTGADTAKWIFAGWSKSASDTAVSLINSTSATAAQVRAMEDQKASTITAKFTRSGYPDIDVPISIATGTGWIEIATWDDFKKIGNDAAYPSNGKYIQTANIVAAETDYTAKPTLSGIYNGGGYSLDCANITTWSANGGKVGLFSELSATGAISNLTIRNLNLTTTDTAVKNIGAIAYALGSVSNVSLQNSTVTIPASIQGANIGGLIGAASGASAKLTNLSAASTRMVVTMGGAEYVGTLAGAVLDGSSLSGGSVMGCQVSVNVDGAVTPFAGGAIGRIITSSISGISVSNTAVSVKGKLEGDGNIGGIAGYIKGNSAMQQATLIDSTAENVDVTGEIIKTVENVMTMRFGGAIGNMNDYLAIQNVHIKGGTISSIGDKPLVIGGFTSVSKGLVKDCSSSADIKVSMGDSHTNRIGGFVGDLGSQYSATTLTNCYYTGTMEIKKGIAGYYVQGHYIGGFIGQFLRYPDITVTNCYMAGHVTIDGDIAENARIYNGGFVGSYNPGADITTANTFQNCMWVSNFTGAAGNIGKGLDHAGLSALSASPRNLSAVATGTKTALNTIPAGGFTFSGWTADATAETATIDNAASQSTAAFNAKAVSDGVNLSATFKKSGYPDIVIPYKVKITDDWIPVYTWEDFKRVSGSGKYIQMNDIAATDSTYVTKETFSGTYDGGGYSLDLSAIKADGWTETKRALGVFGELTGTLCNLTIRNLNMQSSSNTTGSIGKVMGSGTLENVHVTGATIKGIAKDVHLFVGALTGYMVDTGTIRNCSTDNIALTYRTDKSGTSAGGAVGEMQGGTIDGLSVNNLDLAEESGLNMAVHTNIGGAIGKINGNKTTDCTKIFANKVRINTAGAGYAGGILGNMQTMSDANSPYPMGLSDSKVTDVTIRTSKMSKVGGAIGNIYGLTTKYTIDIKNVSAENGSITVPQAGVTPAFGGFVGDLLRGTLTNCYTDLTVNGGVGVVGGFVGSINTAGASTIEDSFTLSKINSPAIGKGAFMGSMALTGTAATFSNNMYVENYNPGLAANGTSVIIVPEGITGIGAKPSQLVIKAGERASLTAVEGCGYTGAVWESGNSATASVEGTAHEATITGVSVGKTEVTAAFTKEDYVDAVSGYTMQYPQILAPVSVGVRTEQPIEIDSYEKFAKIGNDPAYPSYENYVQTADFGVSMNTVHKALPEFIGSYDGQGYSIDCTNIGQWKADQELYVGLFGVVNGKIRNLTVKNVNIDVHAAYIGAVAAYANNREMEIKNVTVSNARISGKYDGSRECNIGGVIGQYDMGTLRDILVRDITLVNTNEAALRTTIMGGIAGRFDGTESKLIGTNNAENISLISAPENGSSGTGIRMGGAVGNTEAGSYISGVTVKNVSIKAQWVNFTSDVEMGGLIAGTYLADGSVADGQKALIENCSVSGLTIDAAGQKAASVMAGGVVGRNFGAYRLHNITASAGSIDVSSTASANYIGGFVGWLRDDGSVFENCMTDIALNAGAMTGTVNVGGFAGLVNDKSITFTDCISLSNIRSTDTAVQTGGFVGQNRQTGANLTDSFQNCAWLYNNTPCETAFGSGSATGTDHVGVQPIGIAPRSMEVLTGDEGKTLTASEAGGYTFEKWQQLGGGEYVSREGYEYDLATSVKALAADGVSNIGGVFKRVNSPDIPVYIPVTTGSGIVTVSTWEEFVQNVTDGKQCVQVKNIMAPAGITAYEAKKLLSGSYDGGGYTIDVSAIPASAYKADANGNVGLFGELGANVKNVTLTGVHITTDAANAGGLAGKLNATANIENVRVSGNIASIGQNTGLLAGVIEAGAQVGGTGVSGSITPSGDGNYGGFAGSLAGSVSSSYAFVELTADAAHMGGFAGEVIDGAALIDAIWSPLLSGKTQNGAGSGAVVGIRTLRTAPETVNVGIGGVMAVTLDETDEALAALGLAADKWTAGDGVTVSGGTGKMTDLRAGLKEAQSSVSLSLRDEKLKKSYAAVRVPVQVVGGAIPIGNLEDLKKVGSGQTITVGETTYTCSADATYVQTADIAVSGTWTSLPEFKGTYNGAGYKVTFGGDMGAGLFSKVTGTADQAAEITNLKVVLNNAVFSGVQSGGIAGSMEYAALNGISVTGSVAVAGTVETLGGIAGDIAGGTLRNSGSSANLDASAATGVALKLGGLFGSAALTQMDLCYAGGSLNSDAAGLAAEEKYMGGLVGELSGSGNVVKNSISGAKITNSVAISGTQIGAFIGADVSNGTVYANNYFSSMSAQNALSKVCGTGNTDMAKEISLVPQSIYRQQGAAQSVNVAAPSDTNTAAAGLAFGAWSKTGDLNVTLGSANAASTTLGLPADVSGKAELTAEYRHSTDTNVKLLYKLPVELSADSTPPVISDVKTEIADQMVRVKFTVTDDGGGSGVDTNSLKYGMVAGDRNAKSVTGYTVNADGSVLAWFDVEKNGIYYLNASDKAGNAATEYGPMSTSETLISVSVPTKMLFAVVPMLSPDRFIAPEYKVENKGTFRDLKFTLTGMSAAADNGFSIVAKGTALSNNTLSMDMKNVSGFNDLPNEGENLVPSDTFAPIAMGTIGRYNGTAGKGSFTFTGQTFNYPLGSEFMTPLKGDFGMTFKIETTGVSGQ